MDREQQVRTERREGQSGMDASTWATEVLLRMAKAACLAHLTRGQHCPTSCCVPAGEMQLV
jgi:hypothetical protein